MIGEYFTVNQDDSDLPDEDLETGRITVEYY